MALCGYRKLEVWQRSMELVESVYQVTPQLPDGERYGLKTQIQRASVSIPANIAEGYGRRGRGEYVHHLCIARGSLYELETHLTLTVRLDLVARAVVLPSWKLLQQVGQMLSRLIASLERGAQNPRPGTRHAKPETRDPRPETRP
jgi:four helix bundle protein